VPPTPTLPIAHFIEKTLRPSSTFDFYKNRAKHNSSHISFFQGGYILKEPGLDGRHRDQAAPLTGRIERKRSDTLNKNLPRPIDGFSGNATVGTMRKETGKIGIEAIRKASKNR
jgi:hypothetical protein